MIIDGKSASLTFNGAVIGKVEDFEITDAVTPVQAFKSMQNVSRATPGVVDLGRVRIRLYRDHDDAGQLAMQSAQQQSRIETLTVALNAGAPFDLQVFVVQMPYVGSDDGTGTALVVLQVATNGI